jgi:hypothetical protein
MERISHLPELRYELFYFLPAESILNMCQVGKIFADICNDDNFWMNKLRYDYPEYFNLKTAEMSWKQTYLDLAKDKIKPFPLYFRGNLLAYIWLRNTNTEREAHAAILELFDNIIQITDRFERIFVHVLLPGGQQYVPTLYVDDTLIVINNVKYNGSLWNNSLGFEIIEGLIGQVQTRHGDELPIAYVSLPDGSRFRINL